MAETDTIEKWSGFKSWLYSLIQGRAKRNSEFVDFAGIGPGDRVLDIGCGPGASLEASRDAGADLVAGVDPSPAMVKGAAKRVPEADVKEGSVEDLPFDNDEFTVVFSIAAFHHWADQDKGVEEMLRVLEPGGAFYIVERKLNSEDEGHGISPEDATSTAEHISTEFGVPARVEGFDAGRSSYLAISGAKTS